MDSYETHRSWRSRPRLAAAMQLAAHALPILLSAASVYGASLVVPAPRGSHVADLVWWLGVSGGATLVLVGTGRLSRRLLPLAALMRLSLVFPDAAPSRFRFARQTGTVETLEHRLAAAKAAGADATPPAARLLLGLVAMLDTHDLLTRGHSERVRAYAQAIGRELGLGPRDLDRLNWAALLHDVGKLEVPTEILTRDGRPTDAEWAALKRHPELGEALVAPLRDWLGGWCSAVGEHHERWDGRGYPRGLAGDEISLAGRIVAVADVFDVITSVRSYKAACSPAAAREEIARCAGTQFDPDVVRAFLAISVRRSRANGALAWLAQAPVLGRVLLAPAASTVAAAAVVAGTAISVGAAAHPVAPAGDGYAEARRVVAAVVDGGSVRLAPRPRRAPTFHGEQALVQTSSEPTDRRTPGGSTEQPPEAKPQPVDTTIPPPPTLPALPQVATAPALLPPPLASVDVPDLPGVPAPAAPTLPEAPALPAVPPPSAVPPLPAVLALPAVSPPPTPLG